MTLRGDNNGRSTLTVTTAPTREPVSANELIEHLRADQAEDHDLIKDLAQAAREYAEDVTGRALVTQTLTYALDAFPAGGVIQLPKPPLASVTSITYTDVDDASQTMSTGDYSVDTAATPGRILLEPDASWPTSVKDIPGAVSILYVAGYGNPSSVPESIRAAIKLLVGNWYENREATISGTIIAEVPMAAKSLLWSNRVYTFR
ncbi:MAG: head-tail connector protein [Acidimicrobiia bacterium]|nr:head-tail connector protein [Acidimicrobiia bacterium]